MVCLWAALAGPAAAGAAEKFRPTDVFELENASDPQLSPDGKQVVYVRVWRDVMADRTRSNLWLVDVDGERHRALTSGKRNDSAPRWSPDGRRLLYVSRDEDGKAQVFLRWMDTGETAQLTHLTRGPSEPVWSPDGKWIAFTMFVPEKKKSPIRMPDKPKGAEWAKPPKYIDRPLYRSDGAGYREEGSRQIFVLSAEGGTPRQITEGPYPNPARRGGRISWTADSRAIIFSANREKDWEYEPLETELYRVDVQTKRVTRLTSRKGPDTNPAVSPDGKKIAYLGFDDKRQWYQVTQLYVMNADGSGARALTGELDRSVSRPVWADDGSGVYFRYDDRGVTKIGFVTLDGEIETVASDVGGTSMGRPYSSGSFSAAAGKVAFTWTDPQHPAEVAVTERGAGGRRLLTDLNGDLLAYKKLAAAEELECRSGYDQRPIQAWILKPPDFDASKKYPLILEIHGGPVANYGPRFSAEMQLYAAAGYLVLYANPRGSNSYGEEFGNLIQNNYPGQDYDDLMAAVDAAVAKGYVDPERLYVTGGSGGGVLTAWIVGKTDRFRAAVSAKPVINWYSWVLTSDHYVYFARYWFPGPPWEHMEHYMKRSPISLVGNVKTPTMVLTGEEDYRTPISESEQYYQALKLRKVPAALVRVPGASHNIAARPSRLIAKTAAVMEWFARWGGVKGE